MSYDYEPTTKADLYTDVIVPPEGDPNSRIVLLGEAPGFYEGKYKQPFYPEAPSGGLLNLLISQAGFTRTECLLDNVVNKRPYGNIIEPIISYNSNSKKVFVFDEYQEHEEATFKRLEALPEKNIIISLGNTPLYMLTKKWHVTSRRGSLLWSERLQCKIMVCVHPAMMLRTRAGGEVAMSNYLYRHCTIQDFRRAYRDSKFKKYNRDESKYILHPSYEEAMVYLERLMKRKRVSFDIEVIRDELSHISFSPNEEEAISIDFLWDNKNTWEECQELNLMKAISRILESREVNKVGQNLVFDTKFLFDRYGIDTKNVDDTMIAHKTIYPDMRSGLDFINSMYTEIPYYKDEGKSYLKIGGDQKDFSLYNARDSLVCSKVMPPLECDLIYPMCSNAETYLAQKSLIEPTVFMSTRAMRVDIPGFEAEKKHQLEEAEELQEELNTLTKRDMNVRSFKQMKDYFYIEKGLTPYLKNKRPTLDEGALIRLARRGHREARLALNIRSRRNLVSKTLDINFYKERLTCSYRPVTKTGRLASSKDIFGYGTNNQNIPKKVNKFFLADDGYLIGNVDLSQADNRSVAYIAPEPRMIKAFEDEVDVHSLTASLLFGIPIDEIIQMDEEEITCDIGYGDQTHRYWGKKSDHAFNFGRGYKSFSYEMEILETEGKVLWRSYHSAYPGVEQSYHRWIQAQLGANRILTNCFERKYCFLEKWGHDLFKQGYAFIPQSNTADIVNRWGLIPFYYEPKYKEIELLRQVHDSINFQIPISCGAKRIAEVLVSMKSSLERPLRFRGRTWIIPAEFSLGYNLGKNSQKEIVFDENLPSQIKGLIDGRVEGGKGI